MAQSKKRAYIMIASTVLLLLNTIPTTIATNNIGSGGSDESSSFRRLKRNVHNNKRDINDIVADKTVVGNGNNRLLRQVGTQNINEVQNIKLSEEESSTQNDKFNNDHRQLNFASWFEKFTGGGDDDPTTPPPQTTPPTTPPVNNQLGTLPPDVPLPTNPPVMSTPAPSSSGSVKDPLNTSPPTLQMVQNSAGTLSPTTSNPTPMPSVSPITTPSPTKAVTTEPTPQIVAKTTTTTNNTPKPTRKIYSPGVRYRPTRDPTPLPTPVVGTPTTSSPVSDEPTKEIDPKSGGDGETESPTVETSVRIFFPIVCNCVVPSSNVANS